jgi:hypothetical protein
MIYFEICVKERTENHCADEASDRGQRELLEWESKMSAPPLPIMTAKSEKKRRQAAERAAKKAADQLTILASDL